MIATTSRSSLIILPRPSAGSATGHLAGISDAAGLSDYEVRQRCLKARPALLLRSTDWPTLERKRESLVSLGHGAAIASDDEVRSEPYPLLARSARVTSGGIDFSDVSGR